MDRFLSCHLAFPSSFGVSRCTRLVSDEGDEALEGMVLDLLREGASSLEVFEHRHGRRPVLVWPADDGEPTAVDLQIGLAS